MIRTVLLVFFALLMIGLLPVWPYSASWSFGYYPSAGLLFLLVLLLFLTPSRNTVV